jgi:hypothetical protein
MSQAGMVVHWWRLRGRRWVLKATINGIGAVATAVVALMAGVTKFFSGEPIFQVAGHAVHAGSWIVIVLIPVIVFGCRRINRHYRTYTERVRLTGDDTPPAAQTAEHVIIVPISDINKVTLNALTYARSLSSRIVAVHVTDDAVEATHLQEEWERFGEDASLVILESPYRSLIAPLLSYIDAVQRKRPQALVTVLVPEYVPQHWWEQLLHSQTALRLKAALLFRPNTVVTSVPYHSWT